MVKEDRRAICRYFSKLSRIDKDITDITLSIKDIKFLTSLGDHPYYFQEKLDSREKELNNKLEELYTDREYILKVIEIETGRRPNQGSFRELYRKVGSECSG